MLVSVVIRTYNEARHLPDLLAGIERQQRPNFDVETVVVDSGSTDGTVAIAQRHGARIVHIPKESFSFGRSLNVGCEAARGEHLVFVSGHCVPVHDTWLERLCDPLRKELAVFAYGRQMGNGHSRFSECQIFRKYFPEESRIPQEGFFVNNANSALVRSVWERYPFDEELPGLEDMALGKRLVADGHRLAYVAEAPVYHLHDESWRQIRWRYQREAIALQQIMPEVHVSFADFLRYTTSAVLFDMGAAVAERRLPRTLPEILAFRFMQFWGSYRGNHEHRMLSREMKERYFYPR